MNAHAATIDNAHNRPWCRVNRTPCWSQWSGDRRRIGKPDQDVEQAGDGRAVALHPDRPRPRRWLGWTTDQVLDAAEQPAPSRGVAGLTSGLLALRRRAEVPFGDRCRCHAQPRSGAPAAPGAHHDDRREPPLVTVEAGIRRVTVQISGPTHGCKRSGPLRALPRVLRWLCRVRVRLGHHAGDAVARPRAPGASASPGRQVQTPP